MAASARRVACFDGWRSELHCGQVCGSCSGLQFCIRFLSSLVVEVPAALGAAIKAGQGPVVPRCRPPGAVAYAVRCCKVSASGRTAVISLISQMFRPVKVTRLPPSLCGISRAYALRLSWRADQGRNSLASSGV